MEVKKTIDIKELIRSKNPRLVKLLPFFVISYFRRILHEKELNIFFSENKDLKNQEFCSKLLDSLNLKVDIQGIDNIPKNGPVIIAMNHPLGGMDAVALISGLKEHRRDLKFIVNDLSKSSFFKKYVCWRK